MHADLCAAHPLLQLDSSATSSSSSPWVVTYSGPETSCQVRGGGRQEQLLVLVPPVHGHVVHCLTKAAVGLQVAQLLSGRRYAARLTAQVDHVPDEDSAGAEYTLQVHNPEAVAFNTAPAVPSVIQPPALAQRARKELKVGCSRGAAWGAHTCVLLPPSAIQQRGVHTYR